MARAALKTEAGRQQVIFNVNGIVIQIGELNPDAMQDLELPTNIGLEITSVRGHLKGLVSFLERQVEPIFYVTTGAGTGNEAMIERLATHLQVVEETSMKALVALKKAREIHASPI